MADSALGLGAAAAILFGVSVDATLTIFGATNSSPQTTELFARERETTLMWYVRAGLAGTMIVIAVMFAAALKDGPKVACWAVAGGILAGGGMWWLYQHALKAGKKAGQGVASRSEQTVYGAY